MMPTIRQFLLIILLLGLSKATVDRGEYSCVGVDNLLIVVQGVEGQEECSLLCRDTDGCALFTWEFYVKSSNSTPGYCLLYSHCELIASGCPCQECSQCITGVASEGTCDLPVDPQDGTWQCQTSEICSSDSCAISCSLSCSPGHAPFPRSLSTCVAGSWSTLPSSLMCDETRLNKVKPTPLNQIKC